MRASVAAISCMRIRWAGERRAPIAEDQESPMTFVSFDALLAIVSVIAGGIASVAGFGIGSLLTPLFALRVDMRTAVAAVSVPHVIGTAFRFWRLRGHVDRRVLLSFGITSALGGL